MAISQNLYALIAGVGPGTGRAVALRFAQTYPVVLLARKPESYEGVVSEIRAAGGQAFGVTADTSDAESVKKALGEVKELEGRGLGAAVCEFLASSSFLGMVIADGRD